MPNYPQFEQKVADKIVGPLLQQGAMPGYGIIVYYDNVSNTAIVQMATRGSENAGEVYKDVPCPVYMGVQNMAPEAGRPCWVEFKDNSTNFPVITHYFNHAYEKTDYARHTKAKSNIPRYMLGMGHGG